MSVRSDPPAQRFPDTKWTLVARASEKEGEEHGEALEALCKIYWPPVFAYIRSRGVPESEAEDLTQSFFAEFLERENFAKADMKRGKLRSFILRSVSNYLANDHRDKNRLKRGGGAVVSLDRLKTDSGAFHMVADESKTPEKVFDQHWAIAVLNDVVNTLRERYKTQGQVEVFDALKFVISPGQKPTAYAEVARELEMSETAIKVAALRLRKRYARQIRTTVAATLPKGADVDEEIRELMSIFC